MGRRYPSPGNGAELFLGEEGAIRLRLTSDRRSTCSGLSLAHSSEASSVENWVAGPYYQSRSRTAHDRHFAAFRDTLEAASVDTDQRSNDSTVSVAYERARPGLTARIQSRMASMDLTESLLDDHVGLGIGAREGIGGSAGESGNSSGESRTVSDFFVSALVGRFFGSFG